MANIKIKFRPSTVEGKEGTLYYQVIHDRKVRQISTGYRVFPGEWDAGLSDSAAAASRRYHLRKVREGMETDLRCLREVIRRLEESAVPYDADRIVRIFRSGGSGLTFFPFMQRIIHRLQELHHDRTAETYHAAYRSLLSFRGNEQLPFGEVSPDLMLRYENHLRQRGLSKNTTSFYMRILRAVFNRAVEEGLVPQCHPFRHVYTGVDKTVKRAVSLPVIRRLKALDLSRKPHLDLARDLFLFSFYTRGMSFVDMAYLRQSDRSGNMLVYRRRKTGQRLLVRWEPCMQAIVDKYASRSSCGHLLPILDSGAATSRRAYLNALSRTNRNLHLLGALLRLDAPLTMYVARHSWASIARHKNIPLSVISEGMGHDSEHTTQIYLASLDNRVVDGANRKIIGSL